MAKKRRIMTNKTGSSVRLKPDAYEKLIKLKAKMQGDNININISNGHVVSSCIDYVLKNYKTINQSDQLDLNL